MDALKIGSEIIKHVHTTKFLGLHIDENLNWSEHLKYVKSKLSSSLFAMRTAKNVLPAPHSHVKHRTYECSPSENPTPITLILVLKNNPFSCKTRTFSL